MDLTAIVNAVRRMPAVAELRAGGDRIAVALRLLVPIVESSGAMPELARQLRARVWSDTVSLVLPAGSGAARIDLGRQQIAIPAALRDAILAALEQQAAARAAAPPPARADPAPAFDPAATARLIGASAQTAALAAARASELPRAAGREPQRPRAAAVPAHASFDAPLLATPPDSVAAAARLQTAVRRSGLFFESHLAAWVRSGSAEPGLAALRDDLLGRAALPTAARTAAQLDVLARDAVQLQGPVWPGQTAAIELRREPAADADAHGPAAATAAAFSAQLKLDLPALGPVEVHLRLIGATVAVTVQVRNPAAVERELPQLAAQFELRGLQPAALQAVALS